MKKVVVVIMHLKYVLIYSNCNLIYLKKQKQQKLHEFQNLNLKKELLLYYFLAIM